MFWIVPKDTSIHHNCYNSFSSFAVAETTAVALPFLCWGHCLLQQASRMPRLFDAIHLQNLKQNMVDIKLSLCLNTTCFSLMHEIEVSKHLHILIALHHYRKPPSLHLIGGVDKRKVPVSSPAWNKIPVIPRGKWHYCVISSPKVKINKNSVMENEHFLPNTKRSTLTKTQLQ
jgi:hypothetical protein